MAAEDDKRAMAEEDKLVKKLDELLKKKSSVSKVALIAELPLPNPRDMQER